jgi:RHH-type proline utilization regulon transcriptional repressor/proline dehydrogenase/delta 1-pyrroline-5-carboxylate dehydrogenase
MGEALYAAANQRYNGVILRAYAPVGGHEDLLPYLVRRLLENGANTSFVHALLDEKVPAARVVEDPIGKVEARPGPHPRIATPENIYGDRRNTLGIDLASNPERDALVAAVRAMDGEGPLRRRPSSPASCASSGADRTSAAPPTARAARPG